MRIAGSKVLLTGANGGIGRAFVDELLRRDVGKVYLGVRQLDGHDFANDERLQLVPLDMTMPASIEAVAKLASDVNILINNAGFAAFEGALTADGLGPARQEMEINYFGPLQLTRALRGSPVYSAFGAIVNIASFLGLVTLPLAGTYSASKAANIALARTIRAELKGIGTRVVAVLPVQTETRMATGLPDPKVKPSEVASEALDAVESGLEDVFPGAPTKAALAAFTSSPAAVQAQFSQLVHSL